MTKWDRIEPLHDECTIRIEVSTFELWQDTILPWIKQNELSYVHYSLELEPLLSYTPMLGPKNYNSIINVKFETKRDAMFFKLNWKQDATQRNY